jgi:hypothetical protein
LNILAKRLRSGSHPKIKLLFTHRQSYQNKLTRRISRRVRPFLNTYMYIYIYIYILYRYIATTTIIIVRHNICNIQPPLALRINIVLYISRTFGYSVYTIKGPSCYVTSCISALFPHKILEIDYLLVREGISPDFHRLS